ncbi:integral membrane protein, YkoY family [Desulfosporosinus acidiphilus SJ4]|uniref:Integral membrane protein, YkoY family n=1 Tax=Desulfosporosinus acidiphilus (strain DSM 22704 / JCM 16185 / SJ4) TaxID=646529 RepID=I4D515_DESAJ|nr:TerC family protein [Desulfosporosinus acidiphilus]AFM40889.1 integral membrane protein, YkoY family [Desulfosporosinus acidiphilus SJ4]
MDSVSSFFHGVSQSYAQFFSLHALLATLSDPVSFGIIGSLIILEGLLSADNALVLAVIVRELPKRQQKKALFYGIWGAYLFRFLAIGFGVYLVQIRWVKMIGALYLLWMSFKYFFMNSEEEDGTVEGKSKSFWGTVLQVELMDIAFSIDSVLAAFGVSGKVWVLFLGAVFGILMMRGVARIFLILIEKFPEIETTAYVLISLIGLKMMASVFGYIVSDSLFFVILVVVFFSTFFVHYFKSMLGQKDKPKDDNDSKENKVS